MGVHARVGRVEGIWNPIWKRPPRRLLLHMLVVLKPGFGGVGMLVSVTGTE